MASEKTPVNLGPPDPWKSDKETWLYISVPDENPLGQTHASIGLNKYSFEAGKTYLVPPQVAETVKERIKTYTRACIRQLQPNRDVSAENAVSVGTAGGGVGAQAIDPSNLH